MATRTKKTTSTRAATGRTGASAASIQGALVRVRMYRQGLGDCFLLTFYTAPAPVHMLIDFGSIGEQTTGVTTRDVAKDIVAETGGHLDLLVATHEHQDHVNGFLKQRQLLDPPGFTVDRVWQAWTEDGSDPVAQQIERYRGDLLRFAISATTASAARGAAATSPLSQVKRILAFVGDVPPGNTPLAAKELSKTVQEAMAWVTGRAENADKFLRPGTVISPDWLPGIRFYVLGPPRDPAAIKVLGSHGDKDLYELAPRSGAELDTCARYVASGQSFARYRDGLSSEERAAFIRANAFDPRFRVEESGTKDVALPYPAYGARGEEWRRIDNDWLDQAPDLALQLDNATNNTSLVLAIEIIRDGRVLLFPGDAQKGNWLSWDSCNFKVTESDGSTRTLKASELLQQTVLYKVGHHSSHNGTMKAHGLELMQRPDLVAMIPLDASVASNKWPTAEWPATMVYEALMERTKGRVLRSDTGWPAASLRPAGVSKAEWDQARKRAEEDGVVRIADQHIDFFLR